MANQKGIIALEGNLKGINFYIRKGKPVARKAGGGFTAKAIKTKPSMERVRENGSEFGGCSKVKKQLRLALLPFLRLHHDSSLHGRMMRMLQEVKNYDSVSERGQRTVAMGLQDAMGRKLFTDFAFTAPRNVSNTLNCTCIYTPEDFTLTMDHFNMSTVVFPSGSSHLEIKFGVLAFDFTALTYTLHESIPQVLTATAESHRLQFYPQTPPDTGLLLFAFGSVHFYQEVGGALYPLQGDNVTGVECFGVIP